jgi:prepilin-type N-terminal cleavage/methylation domain-containing protein
MNTPDLTTGEKISMKNEQGFSLIELLIVVAIIAIIAAIAVPSMLQARMAANEAGAIQGCRTVGSAEVAFSAVNNQNYATLANLQTGGFVDTRFTNGFSGYGYAGPTEGATFAVTATPLTADSTGRYKYSIAEDQIVRYAGVAGTATAAKCGANACNAGTGAAAKDGDPIGTNTAAAAVTGS